MEKDLFATGDYSFWSGIFEPSSEALTRAAGVSDGNRVLDIAAGNGNVALAAARRGAIATAADLSPAQIERGRDRARGEGRSLTWIRADARRLPFADDRFDRVFNSFGDEIALDEMFRVAHPGGFVGITAWTGARLVSALGDLYESLGLGVILPPEGGAAQDGPRWGREDHARAALAPYARYIDISRHVLRARFESVQRFSDELSQKDPYLHVLYDELSPEQWSLLSDGLRRLAAEWNKAEDGTLLLEFEYLMSVASKGDAYPAS